MPRRLRTRSAGARRSRRLTAGLRAVPPAIARQGTARLKWPGRPRRSDARPKRSASRRSTAARRRPRRLARWRFATSIRCCATIRLSRFLRRRCSASRPPKPASTRKDDTWVGINFVRPEDDFVSMRDYTLQMKMVGYLHSVYPDVHISLHAGELAWASCRRRDCAFTFARRWSWPTRERIGHGVDVMYEDRPHGSAERDGAEARDDRDQPEFERRDSWRRGERTSVSRLPRGEGAGGALD